MTCTRKTCDREMTHLGTSNLTGTTIDYWECDCGNYQRIPQTVHDEPQMELMIDG